MNNDSQDRESLGDDRTFTGERDPPPKEEQSLGDTGTRAGGLDSSFSDLDTSVDGLDDSIPLVDLSERYEVQGALGRGGMGEVLRAVDTRLKRPVAIKRVLDEMAQSKKALSRFLTEAQSIAALNHFNIVQIYDYGRDTEGPFIIMELVEGESLQEKLKAGPLDLEEAVELTCQLCDGLAVAHEQGIIHRDIKPANILLTRRGEPKLTDFGLARHHSDDHGHTQSGVVLGTLDFMPPEQRVDATAVDERSDLWSLAATFYQMLTGEVPRVIDLDAIPQNLRSVFARALKQNPEERFPTAEEFKAALRKGMATELAVASPDLVAGVCPSCNTANDASRKFCRKCRASLTVPCIFCEADNPSWEDICGQCGCSQQEAEERLTKELTSLLEDSRVLARDHAYEAALVHLMKIQENSHAFTSGLRQQAMQQAELISGQRDEQFRLRDQLVELARQHQQYSDYAAAARELARIPTPLRSSQLSQELASLESARDELAGLLQQISAAVKARQYEGLLEKTSRCLELNPHHERIAALHEKLLVKAGRHPRQVSEGQVQAQQAYDNFDDQRCLEILGGIDTVSFPALSVLRQRSQARLDVVTDLVRQINSAGRGTPLQKTLLESYLELRPNDHAVRQQLVSLENHLRTTIEIKQPSRTKSKKGYRMATHVSILVNWTMAALVGLLIVAVVAAGVNWFNGSSDVPPEEPKGNQSEVVEEKPPEEKPGRVVVYQEATGAVHLLPSLAQLEGENMQLDVANNLVHGWKNTNDLARWSFRIYARPGMYMVKVEYAADEQWTGGEYKIKLDDEKEIFVDVISTGSQDGFRVDEKYLKIRFAGEHTLTLRASRLAGDELMLLRSIELIPSGRE
jgi:serine/threonine protein kinase